jgi:hypothetical protein
LTAWIDRTMHVRRSETAVSYSNESNDIFLLLQQVLGVTTLSLGFFFFKKKERFGNVRLSINGHFLNLVTDEQLTIE